MAALGGSKRPPVVVHLADFSYRTTVAIYRGEAYVGVRREIQEKPGVTIGKPIEITLTLDDAPRVVELPADLATTLKTAGLAEAFRKFSFTHQREYVAAIDEAKRPETRVKRIALAVEAARAKGAETV